MFWPYVPTLSATRRHRPGRQNKMQKYKEFLMLRIGILSDTHGHVPSQVFSFFESCHELWHAGDAGPGVLDTLQNFKPLVAVYGNMDGRDVRDVWPATQLFEREGVRVLMTHIGGYPGHYNQAIQPLLRSESPNLFVCGHSHILKVMYDSTYRLLHINPGAAGRQGMHKVGTLVRLELDNGTPRNLEILDFPKFQ